MAVGMVSPRQQANKQQAEENLNENSNHITNGFNGEPDNHPCRNQW
jgi:hypothetical protein